MNEWTDALMGGWMFRSIASLMDRCWMYEIINVYMNRWTDGCFDEKMCCWKNRQKD